MGLGGGGTPSRGLTCLVRLLPLEMSRSSGGNYEASEPSISNMGWGGRVAHTQGKVM
jgi:hypothetical protein